MAEHPQKKKKQSHGHMCNITLDKIKWFENILPVWNWRKFSISKISNTLVTKKWSYDERIMYQKHLVPYGMTKKLMEVWQFSKWFQSSNVSSDKVEEELSIGESRYDSKMTKLELSTSGKKDIK